MMVNRDSKTNLKKYLIAKFVRIYKIAQRLGLTLFTEANFKD